MTITRMGMFAGLVFMSLAFAVSTAEAQTNTTTVQWGPVTIPAATENEAGHIHNEIAGASGFTQDVLDVFNEGGTADYEVEKPCEDCYIVDIKPNLVLEDGTTANFHNGVQLHHVVNVNFSRPDITCRPNIFSSKPIKQLGGIVGGNERFFASGNERTFMSAADVYGYYVGEGDDWGLIYHLVNMNPEPTTVYFEYTFTWVDASDADVTRTRPIWVDIDQCGDSQVNVPAGYNDITWDWEADRSHTVTGIGGHVHNYGLSIAWRNETTGENSCTSVAGYAEGSPYFPVGPGTGVDSAHPVSANTVYSDPYGLDTYAPGHISDMTICTPGADGTEVDKGDLMRVHTQIVRPDSTDHDMGIMVGYLDEELCITNFWCY